MPRLQADDMGASQRFGRPMNGTHQGSGSAPPSLSDMLTAAGLLVGLATAWLYMAGWNYAYSYFDHFRIPLLMIELPFEHYLMYGGSLATTFPGWTFFLLCVLLVVALVVRRCAHVLGRVGLTIITIVIGLSLVDLARCGGEAAARHDIRMLERTDFAAFPRVQFVLDVKSEAQKAIGDVATADCGRLVASGKERMFIIRPIKGAPTASLPTIVVSAKSAEVFVITAEYSSCK
ncbi:MULTISPECIES: hypothetical protein [unclassified Bradyrhizobium]|uniref:hypothetical protein n=1 Tax=unclassified Bradyrhizobium TaxID=2631580 RepID=UPI001FFB5190|nr:MULTISPECIES: hypothetical protein [unclassified Bradyrhizobium]MCK1523386.1 hypothetical protein [Bradyrhizobium sp. 17]MCK1685366.1 hypothetical protein [Bradyrhizobium sp. 145]